MQIRSPYLDSVIKVLQRTHSDDVTISVSNAVHHTVRYKVYHPVYNVVGSVVYTIVYMAIDRSLRLAVRDALYADTYSVKEIELVKSLL